VQVVLAATRRHGLRSLLMGGQACVLYGASEFSRDIDLAILADAGNLQRLDDVLRELGAEVIAVPPYAPEYLARGHAVHFRCRAADDIRLDVMARMRNVDPFESCWSRRTVFDLDGVGEIDVMGLADLVACKKTRRDKDWPMVRRLVDVNYREHHATPTPARLVFWLQELRTPETLLDCAQRAPDLAAREARRRPAVAAALSSPDDATHDAIVGALAAEEQAERAADDRYWRPLLDELEALRRLARQRPS
jgi:hypothetical protein